MELDIFKTEKSFICNYFTIIYKITIFAKVRNFQYQILQRIRVLNPLMYKLKLNKQRTIHFANSVKKLHIFFIVRKYSFYGRVYLTLLKITCQ